MFFCLRLFTLGLLFFRLLAARRDLVRAAEQTVHMRKSRRAAADIVVLVFILLHHGHHFTVDRLKILIGNAHALDDLIDLLETQFFGTFEAKPLVGGLAVFHLGYKNHSEILFTSAAYGRFHGFTPFLRKYNTPAAKN